jgi:peptide-methionine (S)-S-oxide reductase
METSTSALATLGGGCFWCLEAVFEDVIGVRSVISGYAGGHLENPSYRAVCRGDTGHAEVVRISFDPQIISYEKLLEIFFAIHDPTTPNRQGNDSGTQYRSIIFYHTEAQLDVARSLIQRLEGASLWDAPVVTELCAECDFYAAEEDHQHYFERNPEQAYCQIVVAPKVAKFRKSFSLLSGRNAGSEQA